MPRKDCFLTTMATLLVAGLVLGAPLAAEEEDEKELGWFDTAEFSLVMTSGNTESQSLALRNQLRRAWESASFKLETAALRAETTTISRLAVGTPDQFDVVESSETAITAENYTIRARFDREISDTLFWFVGTGWERNEFSGIRNRLMAIGGVGKAWFDEDDARFKTDGSLTYTDQQDVVEDPTADDAFFGLRLSWDYARELTSTTKFGNVLIVDASIEESSDYRGDMVTSLAVAMSSRMALKMSLQVLFDNDPALTEIPVVESQAPEAPVAGTALVPLEKLDATLTASLVVDF